MRYVLAVLAALAIIFTGNPTPEVPDLPTVTDTHEYENYNPTATTWAEDSLPRELYDFIDTHPPYPVSDLLPVGTIDEHLNCWSATSTDEALNTCALAATPNA